MRETAPFLIYKRRETWREKGSRVVEDEVLSDRRPNASPPPFSIVLLCRFSGRLALLRGTPVCSRQHLHPIPFRTRTSRHRHLFAGLFGCNHSCTSLSVCHLLIYTYTFVSFTVFVSIRVFCVDGPNPCVSLFIRNRASISLLSLLSPALRFKTPVVPPRFSTHAHNNATASYRERLIGICI